MRNTGWRLAIAAAIACVLPASLIATETAGAAPASSANFTTESPDPTATTEQPKSEVPPNSSPTPQVSPTRPPDPDLDSLGRMLGYLSLFAALVGAGVYIMKFGLPLARKNAAMDRKLKILETRPLGNRQYLLVVGYEDSRMLLGVTPGKIDYLCPLDSSSAPADFGAMMGSLEHKTPRS
jgi:flagellar protein FliO/FliZ